MIFCVLLWSRRSAQSMVLFFTLYLLPWPTKGPANCKPSSRHCNVVHREGATHYLVSSWSDKSETFQQHTTTVTRKQTFKHRHARCKLKKGTWRRSGPEHACGLHRSTALALWRGGEKLGRWRRHELWRGREGRGADIKVWTSLPELAQGHVLLCVFLHHLGHRHLKVLLGNMYPSLAQGKHSSFCADRLNNKNGQMVSYFASARSASKKYQYSTETHRYALRNWSDSFWGHIICKFAIPGRPKFASTKKLLAQVIWI